MSKKINPIAMLGFLGFIGIVGVITGKLVWYGWFAWFIWFTKYKDPVDERLFRNIAQSSLISFFLTVLGLVSVEILIGLNVSQDIVFSVIEGTFALVVISFSLLFRFFEISGS